MAFISLHPRLVLAALAVAGVAGAAYYFAHTGDVEGALTAMHKPRSSWG